MSANLLDPRLHRRAGAGSLAALVSEGIVTVDSGVSAPVAGRGVSAGTPGRDVYFHEGRLGTQGGAVPIDIDGLYTAWVLATGVGQLFYLGIQLWSASAYVSGAYPLGFPEGVLDPKGTLLSYTFIPRAIALDGDHGPIGIGFDLGNDSESAPFEILDIGVTRGRSVPLLARHRRHIKLA